MKKIKPIKLIVLLLLITVGGVGCQSTPKETTTEETELQQETVQELVQETEVNMDITTWITNGIDKLTEDMLPEGDLTRQIDLWMAKNEAEGCQVAFRADKRYGSIAFSCTEQPENGPALELFQERTVQAGEKYYPDPLSPFSGKMTLLADKTTTLYLRFTADANMNAGDYTYHFVLQPDSETNISYTVNVHVWDFALPDTLSCATAMGLDKNSIAKMHPGVEGEDLDALYENYYNKLLEYKVSAYNLPYDILDERANRYMSDPRVTGFCVPVCADDDEKLVQIYEKLCSNPVWLEKAYFYPLDEPTSKEMLDTLAELCERLHRLAPEIAICTPFFLNIDYDANTDQITFMTGNTTLWCPKSYMYVTSNVYSEAQMKKYPNFGERMAERKAAGDKVWWYVCWEPGDPYNNLFVDQKGVQHRILFWQQYIHDVDGFLYWSSNYWYGTSDPWYDMATVKNLSPDVYGDGSLLYNGSKVGLDTACGSLRLEAVRDGIEDFDLFRLAEERFGRDWVEEKIKSITPSLTQYTTNTEQFIAVRNAVGDALAGSASK